MRRIKIQKILIGICVITLICATFPRLPRLQIERVQNTTSFPPLLKKSELSTINGTKTVLMVNPSFWGFRLEMGRIGFINAGCEVTNCVLTTNHSYVKDYNFDAFMVHVPTQRKGPWSLPNRRTDQMFILFSTEPPGN